MLRIIFISVTMLIAGTGQANGPVSSPGRSFSFAASNQLAKPDALKVGSKQANLSNVSSVWARLFGAKQLDEIMELYAPDAVFLTGQGERISGKSAIR